MQRVLRDYFGVGLWHAMNVTDVEDKIIRRANETNTLPTILARTFENEFMQDMDQLGVL